MIFKLTVDPRLPEPHVSVTDRFAIIKQADGYKTGQPAL